MNVLRVAGGPLDGRVVPEDRLAGTKPVILLDVERLHQQEGLDDAVVGVLRWSTELLWYEREPVV